MRILLLILIAVTFVQGQFWLDNIPALPPASGDIVNVSTAAQLDAAITNATDGQTILIADGTYEMISYVPLNINAPNVTIRGASDDPTKVIIKGNGFKSGEKIDCFRVFSHTTVFAYITVEDVRSYGMMMRTGNNDNMLIHGCRWIDCNKRCLKAPGYVVGPTVPVPESHNGEIRYCLFEQKTPITLDIPNLDFNGDYVCGMDMMRLNNWTIHHNVFLNFKGITGGGRGAVFLWGGAQGGCRNMIVENNVFIGNDRSICLGNPSGIADAESCIVRNNFIHAGHDYGLELCFCKDVKVYNNTFWRTNYSRRMVLFFENMGGNTLKNNIVVGPAMVYGDPAPLPDTTGNIWVRSNISSWFKNPSMGDLHLNAIATQAIDQGLVLAEVPNDFDDKPRDANPDIGADEYGNESVSLPWNYEAPVGPYGFTVYPNPFNTGIRIKCSVGNREWGIGSLNIYDLHGRLLHSQLPNPNSQLGWNISNQPNGIYIFKLETDKGVLTRSAILRK
jgi:hypothetical protein